MRAMKVLFFVLWASAAFSGDINSLFPGVDEMPGGRLHWLQSISEPAQLNGCTVYSATYAYFAEEAKPLFDIPRKNIYSVSIRFHECGDLDTSRKLYSKFSEVGEPEFKRVLGVGEKSIIYIQPEVNDPLMGNYYLTTLYRNIVMQVHSDDGFVLVDMADTMSKRLERHLGLGKLLQNGLTVNISKEGYGGKSEFVSFAGDDISSVELSGVVYDQYNNRIAEAVVAVQETGDVIYTDANGEFFFNIESGEDDGENISIFRAFDISGASESGYYRVDIEYASQDKVGQDVWKLTVSPDGTVKGTSLNISDSKRLNFSGNASDGSIKIVRDCGSSVLGKCRQVFTGSKNDDGMYTGTWTGTGGGGRWMLFGGSFAEKAVVLSADEAGYKVKGSKLSSGKKAQYVNMKSPVGKHDDFYLVSAKLIMNLNPVKKQKSSKAIYLYTVDEKGKLDIAGVSPEIPMNKAVQAQIDISDIYRAGVAESYSVGFAQNEKEGHEAAVDISVEVVVATGKAKAMSEGAVKVWLHSFEGDDLMGNIKAPKADGKGDIVFEVDVSAYGGTLKEVEVAAVGKDRRSWNTRPAAIQPGVGVLSGGKLINTENGEVLYPLQKFSEKFIFHVNKGSLNMPDVEYFEIQLLIDNDRVVKKIPLG